MFANFFSTVAVSVLAVSGAYASPSRWARRDVSEFSLNNWGGFSTMSNFDDFYGWNNFYGSNNGYNYIEDPVQCQSRQVNIVQQRLAILQEMAKRVISEQICEVEVQTLVFSQFYESMGSYYNDIIRSSGRHVGYDRGVTSHWDRFFGSDGSLSSDDLGFDGHSIGTQYIQYSGYNWNDNTSRSSCESAYGAVRSAMAAASPTATPASPSASPSAAPSASPSAVVGDDSGSDDDYSDDSDDSDEDSGDEDSDLFSRK